MCTFFFPAFSLCMQDNSLTLGLSAIERCQRSSVRDTADDVVIISFLAADLGLRAVRSETAHSASWY